MLRGKDVTPEQALRFYGVIVILVGTILLIVAGLNNNQIAPAVGLCGTLAGYLLGKNQSPGTTPESKEKKDDGRQTDDANDKTSSNVLALAALLSMTAAPLTMYPQQTPDTVLTNQMGIPVKVQIIDPNTAASQNLNIPPDGSPIVQPGCLRFSTGKPAKTVYYVLEIYHRYDFRSKGHRILLFDTASDSAPLPPANAANSACKLFRTQHPAAPSHYLQTN